MSLRSSHSHSFLVMSLRSSHSHSFSVMSLRSSHSHSFSVMSLRSSHSHSFSVMSLRSSHSHSFSVMSLRSSHSHSFSVMSLRSSHSHSFSVMSLRSSHSHSFSVMSGEVKGDKTVTSMRLEHATPRSRDKHSTTELLHFYSFFCSSRLEHIRMSQFINFCTDRIYTMHNKFSNCFAWVSPSTSYLKFHLLS